MVEIPLVGFGKLQCPGMPVENEWNLVGESYRCRHIAFIRWHTLIEHMIGRRVCAVKYLEAELLSLLQNDVAKNSFHHVIHPAGVENPAMDRRSSLCNRLNRHPLMIDRQEHQHSGLGITS